MIWYFQKVLPSSERVKIEQPGQDLNSFKELVKKAVNNKAKVAFRPHFYTCKTDQHCFWGSRPSAAKASTQVQLMKDLRVE